MLAISINLTKVFGQKIVLLSLLDFLTLFFYAELSEKLILDVKLSSFRSINFVQIC